MICRATTSTYQKKRGGGRGVVGSRSNFNTSLTLSEKGEAIQNWCFSPGTPVSSTNKTNLHDITEVLLEVALNTKP